MKYANLHLHSTHSDSEITPRDLAILAKEIGHSAAALTDHDVISGTKEFMEAAKEVGLETIAGVEFYGEKWGVNFHVVGYDFDIEDKELNRFIDTLCENRNTHTRILVENGIKRGTLKDITWDEIVDLNPEATWFCNNQVFRAMAKKGVLDMKERAHLLKVNFKSEPAFKVKIEVPSLEESVERIIKAGGVAGIAHPHNQYKYVKRMLDEGIPIGLVEVSHPILTKDEEKAFYDLALEHNLYKTGGTDHHGRLSAIPDRIHNHEDSGVLKEDFIELKERRLG
ncbi:MAG: PHP domain-containing protein [Clostridiales bacterium]|nr:PHP domain-containing protein [Clostridiales bacterium]